MDCHGAEDNVTKLVFHTASDQGSNACRCHGERMCANVNYEHGVGCTLSYKHAGDHANWFAGKIDTWPRRPDDWE